MKEICIGLLALISLKSYAQSPVLEISNLCKFHLDFARDYNSRDHNNRSENTSIPGHQQYQQCLERGLNSYQDGMHKVFVDTCTILTSNARNSRYRAGLVELLMSYECREALIETKIPNREEFLAEESKCKVESNQLEQEVSGIIPNQIHRDYFKIIIENNCLKRSLKVL